MTENRFDIRRLGADDVGAAHGLLAVFADAFEDKETYLGAVPDAEYLARLLGRPEIIVLVAEAGGNVVGGLVAYEMVKLERERSEIYVYDLAVEAAHRRRGIAMTLLEAVKPIARACGAHVIFIQADKGDDAPITLYSKLGTREEVLHFDIAPD